jgi:hypothetical protein
MKAAGCHDHACVDMPTCGGEHAYASVGMAPLLGGCPDEEGQARLRQGEARLRRCGARGPALYDSHFACFAVTNSQFSPHPKSTCA